MMKLVKRLLKAILRSLKFVRPFEEIQGARRVNVFAKREVRFGAGRPIGAEIFTPVSSTVPALGYWAIPDGRILGDRGGVTSVRARCAIDNGVFPKWSEFRALFSPVLHLSGTTAMLFIEAGHHNYYHFLAETLPKLELILRSGTLVDHYVAPLNEDFQKDAYRLLGIENKIIPITSKSNIICDHLLATDKLFEYHIYTTPHFEFAMPNYQLDWAAHFLNDRLLRRSNAKKDVSWTKPAAKRFCVSRRRARNRCFLNDDAFVALLNQFGVRQICLEDYSLVEKMHLFANAELIVGQHGAGLTNIVFCRPGTVVLEIVADVLPSQYFQMIAELKGLDYFYLASESVYNNRPTLAAYDNIVDLDRVERFLSQLDSNPHAMAMT